MTAVKGESLELIKMMLNSQFGSVVCWRIIVASLPCLTAIYLRFRNC